MDSTAGSAKHNRGNSSNPRPGQNPFPRSSALVPLNKASPSPVQDSDSSYTSQYQNNFNRSNARYSSGRDDFSPTKYYGDSDSDNTPTPVQAAPLTLRLSLFLLCFLLLLSFLLFFLLS